MIFDTHAHYNDMQFDKDRESLLLSMKEKNVGGIVEISTDIADFDNIYKLVNRYNFVYGTIGVHPNKVHLLNDNIFEEMEQYLKHPKIVAIGEIGLDYFYEDSALKYIQKKWFRKQINLARKFNKAICVHSRNACEDTLNIMQEEHCEEIGGVIHCFSYSSEIAQEYIKMGFYIGVGGVITFKNSKMLKDVVNKCKIENIVLETDCPYLTPCPYRGQRNDSTLIQFIANEVACIKNIDINEVVKITEENGKRLYGI